MLYFKVIDGSHYKKEQVNQNCDLNESTSHYYFNGVAFNNVIKFVIIDKINIISYRSFNYYLLFCIIYYFV